LLRDKFIATPTDGKKQQYSGPGLVIRILVRKCHMQYLLEMDLWK